MTEDREVSIEIPRIPTARAPFRLDPELAAISVLIPEFDLGDLENARALERHLSEQGRHQLASVDVEDRMITRKDGGELGIRIYRPAGIAGHHPALLYIHGGGFVLGSVATEDDRCEHYAHDVECIVVAVDYRLAPEHPFPAAFEDCLDTLIWMHANARQLGIDPRRIAIGGNSAGGALAASVGLESRSSGLPAVVHQLLINPALDSRSHTASMQQFVDTPVWSRAHNLRMWDYYLKGSTIPVDYRAAPALADDLAGSPSTSIWIAEYDPLRDEAYEYLARLLSAGISVGVTQYPGTIHGFDGYRMTTIGQRALRDQVSALRRAFRS